MKGDMAIVTAHAAAMYTPKATAYAAVWYIPMVTAYAAVMHTAMVTAYAAAGYMAKVTAYVAAGYMFGWVGYEAVEYYVARVVYEVAERTPQVTVGHTPPVAAQLALRPAGHASWISFRILCKTLCLRPKWLHILYNSSIRLLSKLRHMFIFVIH